MKLHVTILVSGIGYASIATAQVQKCQGPNGTFYSDRPCPTDTKGSSLNVPAAPPPLKFVKDPQASRSAAAICQSDAVKWLPFKDPGSLQFEGNSASPGQEVSMKSSKGYVPAIRMFVRINAKNSYGGYVGYESYVCYTDPQGQKVIGYSKYLQE